jgi:chitodextrinase
LDITYLPNSSTTALVVINSTQSTGTVTYNVTGLSPSTSYYFRIFARDIDGNFSAPGQSATINTAAAGRTSYTNRIVCKHF